MIVRLPNEADAEYITRRLVAEGYDPKELQLTQERAINKRLRSAHQRKGART